MANLANFPEKYIGHMSSGQGMGGLLPSVVNVIILAFPNSNSQVGAPHSLLSTYELYPKKRLVLTDFLTPNM